MTCHTRKTERVCLTRAAHGARKDETMAPRKPRPTSTAKPDLALEETLERIARETLDIETLKTRNSDSLDFHDVAVWRLKEALNAAYAAGLSAASSPRSK